jgi:transcriptional regulator with PAS, ATPase and Fis domain
MLISLVRRYDQIPWLHQMREIIRRWWRVEVIYVDKEGHPIFLSGQPDNLVNRVCAICLGDPGGRKLCLGAIERGRRAAHELAVPAPAPDRPTRRCTSELARSCHLGLSTLVVPIRLGERGERDGGLLYTSGFFPREPREEERRRLEEDGGAIAEPLASAEVLASVPVLTADDLRRLADVVELGVEAIVNLFAELESKEAEIDALRSRLGERKGFGGLIGGSSGMQEVYRLIERVAANDCTVLIRGESGTGKELVANAIHGLSARASGPFVVQNCSAFNDNLLESELFGHVRGAFTGAVSDKKGLFELASGGTLFLDEVAEMSPALQAKLLRVLQDGSFWPVGAATPRQGDARIVAATHRDLEEMVREGRFREDLYYRLNVIAIELPPLRDRRSDIPALASHLLERHGQARLSSEALRAICDHDWPGNVRELANELERMTVLASGPVLGRELLSPRLLENTGAREPVLHGTLREAVEALEQRMIRSALDDCEGNRSHAAKRLGIARSNLLVKIKSYSI